MVKGIILRVDPENVARLLDRIREEPRSEGFSEEIRKMLEELESDIDLYRKFSKVISRTFLEPAQLIVDPKAVFHEVRSRLISIAAIAEEIIDKKVSFLSKEVEEGLNYLREGRIAEAAEKLRAVTAAYETVRLVLLSVLLSISQIKVLIYLNMPAETRSPVANQMLGFDIVR